PEPIVAESTPPERPAQPDAPDVPEAQPDAPAESVEPAAPAETAGQTRPRGVAERVEPADQPRVRAVPDAAAVVDMPALPEALRARGEASAYLASIRVVGGGGGRSKALQAMRGGRAHG